MAWTPQRVMEMERLWREGYSAAQIARRMGDVTRNAVIGKIYRSGLIASGVTRDKKPIQRNLKPKPLKAKPKPVIPVPDIEEPISRDGSYVTILTAKKSDCRWPIGDPATDDFHFCGNPRDETGVGSSYCRAHRAKGTQTPVARKGGFKWKRT